MFKTTIKSFKILCITSFLLLNNVLAQATSSAYRVHTDDKSKAAKLLVTYHDSLLQKSINNDFLIFELTLEEVKQLKSLGYKLVPQKQVVTNKADMIFKSIDKANLVGKKSAMLFDGIPGFSCYPTVEETYQDAAGFAEQYPDLAEWKVIGESWDKENGNDGYDLNVLVISKNNQVLDKPKLFIHSAMHAREYTTAALTLEFARYLVTNYETDADVGWILNEHEVHILFMMNPDGRKHAESGLLWRKNTNQNFCGATNENRGVDLNRNFSLFWNQGFGGSSGDECDQTFRGTTPASEPETQAVETYLRSLYPDNRGDGLTDAAPEDTAGLHLDIHSSGGLIMWPWGHSDRSAPNYEGLQTLGRKIAAFNGYYPMQSIGLYPTDGTSESISYGELGVAQVTFELGTSFFQDCATYQQDILPNNLQALLYAAKTVDAPYLRPSGPEVLDMKLVGAGTQAVPAGTVVELKALVRDDFYQTVEEQSQNITQVEYAIDDYSWNEPSVIKTFTASDGALDSAEEQVSVMLDTSNLADGSYNIYARAKDADNNWGVVSAVKLTIDNSVITNNQPPVASFTESCELGICQLNASASTDDLGIQSYQWRIDTRAPLHGTQVFFEYSESKGYEVTLEVTDAYDLKASSSKNVALTGNNSPVPIINYSCSGLACSFDGSASEDADGQILEYVWEIEGEFFWQSKLDYQFPSTGIYYPVLWVKDDWGVSGTWANKSLFLNMTTEYVPDESSGGGGMTLWIFLILIFTIGFVRRF